MTMTVAELVAKLSEYPGHLEVFVDGNEEGRGRAHIHEAYLSDYVADKELVPYVKIGTWN